MRVAPAASDIASATTGTGRLRNTSARVVVSGKDGNQERNRDKASLDIFWLRDESLEESDNLPYPEILAQEIAEGVRYKGVTRDT